MAAFKVDENLPLEVAELLQSANHDAMTVVEQQLGGNPDTSIAEVCQRERRAIVTFDLDFADIRVYPPKDYFGIIVLRLSQQSKPLVLQVMQRLLPYLAQETLEQKLWIVDEQSVRVRG